MKIRECYEQMGADYDNVLSRLGSDAIVERFARKFLEEKTFDNLKEAMEKRDAEEAFRAAHTLKGICLNLGFDNLFTVSSELTEKLRPRTLEGSEELLQKVQEQYGITVQALKNIG